MGASKTRNTKLPGSSQTGAPCGGDPSPRARASSEPCWVGEGRVDGFMSQGRWREEGRGWGCRLWGATVFLEERPLLLHDGAKGLVRGCCTPSKLPGRIAEGTRCSPHFSCQLSPTGRSLPVTPQPRSPPFIELCSSSPRSWGFPAEHGPSPFQEAPPLPTPGTWGEDRLLVTKGERKRIVLCSGSIRRCLPASPEFSSPSWGAFSLLA